MKKPSDDVPDWDRQQDKIIGLGEKSIRKSYYPELQRKIRELELEVAERKRREQELKRSYENRAVTNYLLKLSLEDISLDELCRLTAERLYSLNWLEDVAAVTIFLLDENSQKLLQKANVGDGSCMEKPCGIVSVGQCLCGLAVATGEVQFASQVDERHSLRSERTQPHGHYAVPIKFADQALGVITLYLIAGHEYEQREEEFFISVANTLAGIIQRHRIIEEKKQYEAILGQAQKIEAIGTLSGGIAHDFNNLLAPMLGYAELALRDLDEAGRPARHVREVLQAAHRAKDLVKQILTLSHKVEKSLEDLQPINLEPVIREVLGLVRATIPTTIEIVSMLDPRGCQVLIEPTHLHQILLNLCTNAYHAMRNVGGMISVSLKRVSLLEEDVKIASLKLTPGKYMQLKVADSGHGMDQQTVERIFDPYFTTKKQGEGTGLGLSVVNGLIQSYGGHISVYSEPGLGTTFNIYLPCCGESDGVAIEGQDSELPSGSEHLLVVDDELQVGQMAAEMLQTLGYQISLYQDAAEAVQVFEQNPSRYDLLVTDMTMPKMTGLDLLKRIRSLRSDIPAILCTGFSELINEQKALQAGFQKYLMKPIVMNEMAFAVREVLDEWHKA